jgi:hypothetical protein
LAEGLSDFGGESFWLRASMIGGCGPCPFLVIPWHLPYRGGQVMEYKEEKDNIYTWKIKRRKPVTNYTKQLRAGNSDRAFIQIKFHETDTRK